ncbi:DNA repair protein RecO [Solimonas sp. SE-A11]|uniref:DNA repair protein RecO n=1 Tax=Solimonas sp. SE-A11 TaxID=3054954 RepID=UPI00259C9CC5|nr:DNA repair protein RecO [Solimonas sp. SE-A11]MDM4772348.1 DNA repair protein RecO [Solimonas sp. SE-A11]
MDHGRVQLEPCWLLSAKAYSETSLLIEAFSERHGRIGLIAKGARSPKSRNRALLQALRPLLLSWTQRGELAALTGVEANGPPPELVGERLFYGWYLNELLLRLLHRQDPHPDAYRAYEEALAALQGPEAEFALRLFEKRLLADIGYGLEIPDDIEPSLSYSYGEQEGFRAASRGPCSGVALIALRDERPAADGPWRSELRRLMRELVRRQLGGRELETAKLLRQLRARV